MGMTENEALQDIIESGIELGAGDFVDVEALKVAAKALEKQIAKKPIKENSACIGVSKDKEEDFEIINVCPTCGSERLIVGYPCKCGQLIDWGNGDAE